MNPHPVLAVIPARGGSKGLPGKNIRPLAGLPLIVHSIRCAAMCGDIERTIVSTDCQEIAEVARAYGGEVPFLRPAELATDTSAMFAVLQHALRTIEHQTGRRFSSVLLLDPTSPGRYPEDIRQAMDLLGAHPDADSAIAVSEPEFNPLWHSVVERDGYLTPLVEGFGRFTRRQDLPKTYRINAMLYLFRRDYLVGLEPPWDWATQGRHKLLVLPEDRAIHIDEPEQFERTDLLVRHGLIRLPWLEGGF